jgi:hypothetical protein
MAASMVVRNLGMSKQKAFFYGQLTGVIEMVGGTLMSCVYWYWCASADAPMCVFAVGLLYCSVAFDAREA